MATYCQSKDCDASTLDHTFRQEGSVFECDECWERRKAKSMGMKCPMCEEFLRYTHNELNDTTKDTHMYSCPECAFIGFEYYTHQNIEELKTLIK